MIFERSVILFLILPLLTSLACTQVLIKDTIRYDKKEANSRVEQEQLPLTYQARPAKDVILVEAVHKDSCTRIDEVAYDRVEQSNRELKLSGWDIAMASIFGGAGTGLLAWGLTDGEPAGSITGGISLGIGTIYAVFLTVQAIRARDREKVIGQELRDEPGPTYTCEREPDAQFVELEANHHRVKLTKDPTNRSHFRLPFLQVTQAFKTGLRLTGPTVNLVIDGAKIGTVELPDLFDTAWFERCSANKPSECLTYLHKCIECSHRAKAQTTISESEVAKLDAALESASSHSWETLSTYLLSCRRIQGCKHKDDVVQRLRGLTNGSAKRLAFLQAQCIRWKNLGKPLCNDKLFRDLGSEIDHAVKNKLDAKKLVHVMGWSGSRDRYSWDVPAALRIEGKELRYIEAHQASWTTGQSFEVLYTNKSAYRVRAQLVLRCMLLGTWQRLGMGEVTLNPDEMKSRAVKVKTLWGELTALHECRYDSLLVDIIE